MISPMFAADRAANEQARINQERDLELHQLATLNRTSDPQRFVEAFDEVTDIGLKYHLLYGQSAFDRAPITPSGGWTIVSNIGCGLRIDLTDLSHYTPLQQVSITSMLVDRGWSIVRLTTGVTALCSDPIRRIDMPDHLTEILSDQRLALAMIGIYSSIDRWDIRDR